jgi:hypothetical protein
MGRRQIPSLPLELQHADKIVAYTQPTDPYIMMQARSDRENDRVVGFAPELVERVDIDLMCIFRIMDAHLSVRSGAVY